MASVRTEPWGAAPATEPTARLLVLAPDAGAGRIELRDGASPVAPLCRLCTEADGSLWELPHLLDRTDATRPLALRVDGATRWQAEWTPPAGAKPTPTASDTQPTWDRLVHHHIEQVATWHDGKADARDVTAAGGVTEAPWQAFLDRYWREPDAAEAEAPMQLIVRIAERCADWIPDLCARPRRILRRERASRALAKVQDVDAQCLRWLIRQPGRTIAERAGARQRILAVVRTDAVDTLENRVLRDFLVRSRRAADRYLRDFGKHANNARVQAVARWKRDADALLRHSPIAAVPGLAGVAERNYVLQYDARYAELWRWYERLRRQDDERESLAPWQHRTWSEYVELALWQSARGLAPTLGGHGAPVLLRHEADHGCFLDRRLPMGPWALGSSGAALLLRLLRGDRLAADADPVVRQLALCGADAVFVAAAPFAGSGTQGRAIGGVWSLFEPAADTALGHRRAERLARALPAASNGTIVRGLLALPANDAEGAFSPIGPRAAIARLPVAGQGRTAQALAHAAAAVRFLAGIHA